MLSIHCSQFLFGYLVTVKNACSQNPTCRSPQKNNHRSWLPAIIVAILPKCPFCIMAYSGAISMCSGNTLYPNAGGIASYLTVGIAVLVIFSILYNFKGKRSWTAAGIASGGIVLISLSQFYFMNELNYYLGVILLFFGIWYNGSFFYFHRQYIKPYLNYISKLYTIK